MVVKDVKPLSKAQHHVLEFVQDFTNKYPYSPTYDEIAQALGYKSKSVVALHVDNLIAAGFLRKTRNTARSLALVNHENDIDKILNEFFFGLGRTIRQVCGGAVGMKLVDEIEKMEEPLHIRLNNATKKEKHSAAPKYNCEQSGHCPQSNGYFTTICKHCGEEL